MGNLDATASGVVLKSDGLDSTVYVASMLSWFLRISRSTDLEFTCRLIGAAVHWYDIYHLGYTSCIRLFHVP